MKPNNLIGMRFRKLVVIRRNGSTKCRHAVWLCQCDCGNQCSVAGKLLKSGETKSCGCLKSEVFTAHLKKIQLLTIKHGMSGTRIHMTWYDMIRRCNDATRECYKSYGGKGIKVCDEWLDINNFLRDMYESYLSHEKIHGTKNTTIERIDVYGNYEPSNCTWATLEEQKLNTKRNNKKYQEVIA